MLKITNQRKPTLQYVPLKQVNIESTVRSFAAHVTITQIFRNNEFTSIEAVYCFPIEEQAAIYSFTARIDNREIVARLKEKREGQYEYDNTLSQGHAAYLLEQNEQSQDNFIINVGALPPSKECLITISYVTELDLIQGSIIRFVIPTTIVPRYTPRKQGMTISKYVQLTPYTIEFRCRIEKMTGPGQQPYITRLNSPSHHVDIDLSIHDAYIVTFAQQNVYLDRDILLDIKLSDKRANTFVIVESDAAMAAVTPFEEDCYLTLNNEQTNEFIFILDCSGSMRHENKIGLAREAMLFFLKNLPISCYFNIIKFGSKFSCVFNEPIAFHNEVHVRIAEKFVNQIRADLGGTEVLAPLQWLERHPPRSEHARQVFLLTDGEISNVSEVLELCRSMASSTRIFSFGLGVSPTRSLVKGLAQTTNGRFVFIPPNTNIDVYVGEQLEKALRRCITNVRVEWNLGIPVENVPNQLPPAYINDRLIIYALTNNQKIPLNHRSSIEIRTDQSYYRLGITDSDRIANNNTKMIARLAAKALILELEHRKISRKGIKKVRFEHIDDYSKEDIKRRIIDLSLRHHILSPYTVFIGIEKHLNASNIDKIVREVPIQILADHQHIHSRSDDRLEAEKALLTTEDTHSYDWNNQRLDRSVDSEMRYASTNDNNEDTPLRSTMSTLTYPRTTTSMNSSSLLHEPRFRQSQMRPHVVSVDVYDSWPTDDVNIIRYLINKQTSDGLWYFDSNRKTIQDLTGKSFAVFQSNETHGNTQILVTTIVIIVLEVKFMSLRSMWDDAVEKARHRLIDLLNGDWKKLVTLFRNIRTILIG